MFASKKNLYTLLVIAGILAAIALIFGICTLLNTFCVNHFPEKVPDKIVISRIYPEGRPEQYPEFSEQCSEYLEVTDLDTIKSVYERLQKLVYTFKTPSRGSQGYHPYELRLYYGDECRSYDFDFNYVASGDTKYTILGDQLRWLFDMIESDGGVILWETDKYIPYPELYQYHSKNQPYM